MFSIFYLCLKILSSERFLRTFIWRSVAVVLQVKLLPTVLASHMESPLLAQLFADAAGRAAENDPSAWPLTLT